MSKENINGCPNGEDDDMTAALPDLLAKTFNEKPTGPPNYRGDDLSYAAVQNHISYEIAALYDASSEEKKDNGVIQTTTRSPVFTPPEMAGAFTDAKRVSHVSTGARSGSFEATTKTRAVTQQHSPIRSSCAIPYFCVKEGLQKKPIHSLQSWMALSLTLDGRDKITKVIQYTSRFLGWYHESVVGNNAVRYRNLQKNLTEARKAFRLGRTLIEMDKIRNSEVGALLGYHLLQIIVNLLHLGETRDDAMERLDVLDEGSTRRHVVSWALDTKSSSEKESECRDCDCTMIKGRSLSETAIKSTRLATTSLSRNKTLTVREYIYNIVNSMLLSYDKSTCSTPMWKVVGSALKYLGLAGFWAGDNLSYLYSTGFLADNANMSNKTTASVFATRSYFFAAVTGLYVSFRDWKVHRKGALRRALLEYTELKNELFYRDGKSAQSVSAQKSSLIANDEGQLNKAGKNLERVKAAHFLLSLALLKSCCDVVVFSNNPGVDLHLKYRGKKMNEGIQCICGIISACSVLFTVFPNVRESDEKR